MLNDGRPVAAVSKRAGHKSAPVALGIYTHAMPGADEIMMEQFDEECLVRNYNVTTFSKKPQFPEVKLASPTGIEPVRLSYKKSQFITIYIGFKCRIIR